MKKRIIVLGGSSGIGKAIAERFAREGWQVVIGSSNPVANQEAVKGLAGEGHISIDVDITSDEQINNLMQLVQQKLAGFEVLVNSAGISKKIPVLGSDFSEWNHSLQVMLYGAVKTCRALIPLMVDGGRVIHIASIHHERVASGSSAYGMAKAAVTQLSRSLALELAPRNILVNTIAPGFVDTPMSVKEDGKNELNSEWFRHHYITYDRLPLKRPAKPEEIAGVAWFLAGPDASYITGSVVTVDGGLTITF